MHCEAMCWNLMFIGTLANTSQGMPLLASSSAGLVALFSRKFSSIVSLQPTLTVVIRRKGSAKLLRTRRARGMRVTRPDFS